MKKSILITGGSGLLAVNWALISRVQHTVTIGLHNRRISIEGVQALPINIESVNALLGVLSTIKPDVVIHTAGLTSIEGCEKNPDFARHINVDVAKNVARACSILKVSLIHISTDHLFSGKKQYVEEDDQPDPQNVYGRTKAEAEQRVLDACPGALVIRTNFYGWGPSYRRSFSDWIIDSLRTGNSITLFDDVFYTPIIIETLVCAVHDLIMKRASGIFHVVADDRISKYEFGIKIAEKFQLDKSLIKSGQFADQRILVNRPFDMSLSNKKTSLFLGRNIGETKDNITQLLKQEECGFAQEIKKL